MATGGPRPCIGSSLQKVRQLHKLEHVCTQLMCSDRKGSGCIVTCGRNKSRWVGNKQVFSRMPHCHLLRSFPMRF